MTNKLQWSGRLGEKILVIGGDNPGEFTDNLEEVLGPEKAAEIAAEFPTYAGSSGVTGLAAVQAAFPGSAEIFNFRGKPADSEGWVADKWGGKWHQTKFPDAPACQCSNSHGKLALKQATTQAGKPYTGWFCANTFEGKKSDGCAAVFNPPGKAYPA